MDKLRLRVRPLAGVSGIGKFFHDYDANGYLVAKTLRVGLAGCTGDVTGYIRKAGRTD